jgi:hypothetical protein
MPRPDLAQLQKDLLRAGIAPKRVARTVAELDDHFADLVAAGIEEGCDSVTAETQALQVLGDLQEVTAAMNQQPQLKGWAWRWPRLALVVYPLACVAALPAVPVHVGIENASHLARWLACFVLGAFVTALMFLILQLSITLT